MPAFPVQFLHLYHIYCGVALPCLHTSPQRGLVVRLRFLVLVANCVLLQLVMQGHTRNAELTGGFAAVIGAGAQGFDDEALLVSPASSSTTSTLGFNMRRPMLSGLASTCQP
jgi:hypothetical protein